MKLAHDLSSLRVSSVVTLLVASSFTPLDSDGLALVVIFLRWRQVRPPLRLRRRPELIAGMLARPGLCRFVSRWQSGSLHDTTPC